MPYALTLRSVKGSQLTSNEFDDNMRHFDERLDDVEGSPPVAVSIDNINVVGDQLTITYTDATTDGPFTLESVQFVNRGTWAAITVYSKYDTFIINGKLYEVIYPHTSAATFDPAENDGMGHNYYAEWLSSPSNALPEGGTDGQSLRKTSGDNYAVAWEFTNAVEVIFSASTDSALVSTNLAAVAEELEALIASSVAAVDAGAVSFTASTDSDLVSVTVAAALEELWGLIPSLSGYAPLASPALTGNPTAPTPSPGDNDTSIATTGFVKAAIDVVLDGVSASFDTLSEIATALALKLTSSDIGTTVQAYDAQLSSLIRQNSKSAAYTTVLTDGGKHIYHPSSDNNARTFTIDSNANVAYPVGTAIMFINEINTVTIAITSDTLTLAGTGSTGSRTLAANGVATAVKVASTKWVISGTGIS